MQEPAQTEVFFHVGLGKTASTWLQNKVFPHFLGIAYLHPTRYRNRNRFIEEHPGQKILISREMDQQLEREVAAFAKTYPDTGAIIVMRQNAQWIASQYRRFLKNGYPLTFTEFFDATENKGFWKREDLFLYPKIEILHKYFTKPPLVLLYDGLRGSPEHFIRQMTKYTGVECDMHKISMDKHHASYNEKQLQWMLLVSKKIFRVPIYDSSMPRWKIWIRRRPRMWLCYLILYSAYCVPRSGLPQKPLIDPVEMEKINKYYADDWNRVLAAVAK